MNQTELSCTYSRWPALDISTPRSLPSGTEGLTKDSWTLSLFWPVTGCLRGQEHQTATANTNRRPQAKTRDSCLFSFPGLPDTLYLLPLYFNKRCFDLLLARVRSLCCMKSRTLLLVLQDLLGPRTWPAHTSQKHHWVCQEIHFLFLFLVPFVNFMCPFISYMSGYLF